jgi:hypothetical protein
VCLCRARLMPTSPPCRVQDANLLIGRRAHGAHHRPNFEGNYCIVSGWWNDLLDNSGFFRCGLGSHVAGGQV